MERDRHAVDRDGKSADYQSRRHRGGAIAGVAASGDRDASATHAALADRRPRKPGRDDGIGKIVVTE
jgi:hypothetical protein